MGRVCQDVFEPKGLDVDLQEAGSLHLAEEVETKRRAFLLKPDILVRKGRSPRVVADTKWKRLDPRSADLGVSDEDVYQVLAYARRYATDSAVLIYPHHAALGRPGLQRDFVVQAGGASRVVVRVATVDLARLERVAGEVGEAVRARYRRGEAARGSAASLSGLRGVLIRCCRCRPGRFRELAFQLLQLPEHDLGVVAALVKKRGPLTVKLIEDRIRVQVGLQEALRACRRTAWESRVARRDGPPEGGARRLQCERSSRSGGSRLHGRRRWRCEGSPQAP